MIERRMQFVESGLDEPMYLTWKESGLNLYAFVERNRAMVDKAREDWYASNLKSFEWSGIFKVRPDENS